MMMWYESACYWGCNNYITKVLHRQLWSLDRTLCRGQKYNNIMPNYATFADLTINSEGGFGQCFGSLSKIYVSYHHYKFTLAIMNGGEHS